MPTGSDFRGFEFAAGDVRGTRAFKVDAKGRLTGVVHHEIWRPGENIARCLRDRAKPAPKTTSGTDGLCPCGCRTPLAAVPTVGGGGGGFNRALTANAVMTSMGFAPGGAVKPPEEREPFPCSGMEPNCGCGYYGYLEGSNDYFDPSPNQAHHGPVGAVVRGYGKCILGDRGFRAEKAEILALYLGSFASVPNQVLRMRIERNYPAIPKYDDYRELLNDFPPDLPEPDEEFWTAS